MKLLDWLEKNKSRFVEKEYRVVETGWLNTDSGTYWPTVYDEIEIVDWEELTKAVAEFEKEFK